jgi:2',3'-cyclic-nucleotide 2'-phosphodiesterase (5'-nucleotidase family)
MFKTCFIFLKNFLFTKGPISKNSGEGPGVASLSYLGLDVTSFGNRDFTVGEFQRSDFFGSVFLFCFLLLGLPQVLSLLPAWTGKIVAANIRMPLPNVVPYVIRTVSPGLRVAFVGVLPREDQLVMDQGIVQQLNCTSDDFTSIVDARNSAALAGANFFVLLFNSRMTTVATASAEVAPVAPYFDLIASGIGANTAFSSVVNGTLVVSSLEGGTGFVRITLPSKAFSLVAIPANTKSNPLAALETKMWNDLSTCKGSAKLASLSVKLLGRSNTISSNKLRYCRTYENPINVMMLRSMQRLVPGASIAVINTGAVRDDLPSLFTPDSGLGLRRSGNAGPYDVVAGDTDSISPFGNTLYSVNMSSSELCAMSVWALCSDPAPVVTRQLMGSIVGLKWKGTFFPNLTCALTDLRFADTDLPVDCSLTTDKHLVALASFLTTGGDGFPILRNTPFPFNITDRDYLFGGLKTFSAESSVLLPEHYLPFDMVTTRIERVCNSSYMLEVNNGWHVAIPLASFSTLRFDATSCFSLSVTPVDARDLSRKGASLTSVSTVLAPPNDYSVIYRSDGLLVGQIAGYAIRVTIISNDTTLDGQIVSVNVCMPEVEYTKPYYDQFKQPSIGVARGGKGFVLGGTNVVYNNSRAYFSTYCGTVQVKINEETIVVAARSVSTSSSSFNTAEQVCFFFLLMFFFFLMKHFKHRCFCSCLVFCIWLLLAMRECCLRIILF